MKDTCIENVELNSYLDQALSEHRTRSIRAHLAGCDACRQRLEILVRTDAAINRITPLSPSADFDASFWRKVAQLEPQPSRLRQIAAFFTGWRPVLAASAAAALIAAVLLIPRGTQAPTPGEVFMAENINLLNDLELIQSLDLFENWDAIQEMKVEG